MWKVVTARRLEKVLGVEQMPRNVGLLYCYWATLLKPKGVNCQGARLLVVMK
jgi:hypothetical protein